MEKLTQSSMNLTTAQKKAEYAKKIRDLEKIAYDKGYRAGLHKGLNYGR